MSKFHEVKDITFENDLMSINIDGKDYDFDLNEHSKTLLKATEQERTIYRVMASGYGIHWPLIDEDLSIDGLLGIRHEPPAGFLKMKVNA